MHDEYSQVLQNKDYPSYDDLSQMTVLDMIVKESMRLMSVAPGGSREYKSTRNSLFSTNNVIIYSARVD
jgi:hypothetical protein